MRFNVSRHFLLTCVALSIAALLFTACGAFRMLVKTSTATSLVKEFSTARVAGKEITVSPGQAIVMYSDHLPHAGGSGDEAVSKAELKNQLDIFAHSPPFAKISAVWGLSNNCTYKVYIDVYFLGTLHITVLDTKMAHQIVVKWGTYYNIANHYISENEMPCLAT